MKEKLAKLCKAVFAVGQTILMAAVLLIILAYAAAFVFGGEAAVAIDAFIYTKAFPVMFFLAVAFAFIGVIYLYLTGYRTFRFETKRKN